ncbi:MAG TPA: hypothetical protein RMH99_02035 [Sandaracinaceae bacterium LLY-WYZ-13_1]|nr:hypothetical protein [Sandaracinaceae bacterium LLY-WYZ-13_1]
MDRASIRWLLPCLAFVVAACGGERTPGSDGGPATVDASDPVDAGPGCVPDAERCDGEGDEDCDGRVDEGCGCTSGDSRPCGLDTGTCVAGTQACTGGTWSACEGATDPGLETCDGTADEDCDGLVDEGCACTDGATRPCGSDVGACTAGTQTCASGGWGSCTGGTSATDELCGGGADEDCDGTVDEACDCRTGRCAYGICDPTTGACDATASYAVHEVVGWEQIHLDATRSAVWHLSTEYYHHIDATGATRRRYPMPRDQTAHDLAPARGPGGGLDLAIGTRDTTGGVSRCFFQLGAEGDPIRYGDEIDSCRYVRTEARYVDGRLHALVALHGHGTVDLYHYEETPSGVVRTGLGYVHGFALRSLDFHVNADGEVSVLAITSGSLASGAPYLDAWRVVPDGAGGHVADAYRLPSAGWGRLARAEGAMNADGGFHFVRTEMPSAPSPTHETQVELYSHDGSGWVSREIFRGPSNDFFGLRPVATFDADGRIHVGVTAPSGTFQHLHESAPDAWAVESHANPLLTAVGSFDAVLGAALAFDASGRAVYAYAVRFHDGTQRGYAFVPSPL